MRENKSPNYLQLRTLSNSRRMKNFRHQTLKELQLSMLNSLSKNPLIDLSSVQNSKRKKYLDNFDAYVTRMDDSLNKYQLSCVSKSKDTEIDKNPNEKYMAKDDTKLIKKVTESNKYYSTLLSSRNEESNLKIVVPEINYPNPYSSLGVIKHNSHIFDEISKDYLYRQSTLFNKQIIDIQKYEQRHKVKMPKLAVGASSTILDIPVVDLTDKKKDNVGLPHIPPNGSLKLLAYYKYPNKNFPEGREQFSIFTKNNEVIISGGISSNMKNLVIWSLNLDKLEWTKISQNGVSFNRYGHTAIFYQNKLYFFGGKTKYLNLSNCCGLEIFSINEGIFSSPTVGKISPEPRKNHIAELLNNQILIHGGINDENKILSDCYILTLNPLRWNLASINKYAPAPKLYGHTSCVAIPHTLLLHHKFSIYSYPNLEPGKVSTVIKEKGIYIFGGKSKDEGGLSNQLWILITGKKPMEWVQPETKGKPPSPRYFHSMSFYEKGNFIIIHGGRNDAMSDSYALNDTFIFDLENFEWSKVELYIQSGFKILNRCGHQSAIFSNKLIIFGGMNNNNYLGSTLLIVNLDFSFESQPKTYEELTIKQLEVKDDPESHKKLQKIKNDLRKNQLGVVTNINLPPIK